MPKKPKHDETPCPKCKEPIAIKAEICPHCRTEFTAEEVAARVKASNVTMAVGCGSVIALVALVAMCSSGPSVPKEPEDSAKTDVLALNAAVVEKAAACDAAYKRMLTALQNGDAVSAYQAASDAENVCLTVNMSEIEIPVSVGEKHYADLKKTMESCNNAYVSKWSAAKNLKAAIDGDQKASTLAEVKDASQSFAANGMMCALGIQTVATALGAKPEEISKTAS